MAMTDSDINKVVLRVLAVFLALGSFIVAIYFYGQWRDMLSGAVGWGGFIVAGIMWEYGKGERG